MSVKFNFTQVTANQICSFSISVKWNIVAIEFGIISEKYYACELSLV